MTQTPTHSAIALEWDGQGAPRVTAKGNDHLAEQIIALAKQHDIPLVSDEVLVAVLAQVSLDEEIPTQLYAAVAEVIAFAYSLSGRSPGL